jgi:hypothetical protein
MYCVLCPMLSGVGFPKHRDLDVVYCTSPIEFHISRHTLPALVLCSPNLPENSGTYYLAPSIWGRWYQAPHLLEELDAMISRHTSTITGAMLAPPTRELWYLWSSPICLGQMVPSSPICWSWIICLDGKWPIILLRGPLGGLRFFNLLHGSNSLKSLPEDLFPEFFHP